MVQFNIPKRVDLNDIKNILKAYYVEGAHNHGVSTNSVEETAQLSDRVGRQTNFLEEIGIIEKKGKKRKLTQSGEEIAEALMGGNEEQAKARMRKLLTDWEFTSKIQGFVRMQGPVQKEQLLEYITANIESGGKRGKNTIIHLFLWSNLLEESEEGTYSVAQGQQSSKDEEEQSESKESTNKNTKESSWTEVKKADSEKESSNNSQNTSINVKFEFSADDDPNKITKVIKAARMGLTEDLTDDESSPSE